jgi:glucans biosynthesis protein C
MLALMIDLFGPDSQTKYAANGPNLRHVQNVFWTHWMRLRGIHGPVWYSVLLTIFDITAAICLPSNQGDILQLSVTFQRKIRPFPLWTTIILTSIIIRLVYPIGMIFKPLNVQPAYLPQYIFAYCWGHLSLLSHDPHILAPFPTNKQPIISLFASLNLCLLSLGAILTVSMALTPSLQSSIAAMTGGFNTPALLYATWNEISFATIAPALISTFSRHLNTPLRLRLMAGKYRDVARYSYPAFLVHPPVSLAIELFVEALMGCSLSPPQLSSETWKMRLGSGSMALVVGIANVIASWTVGGILVEYMPFVGRVI